ncbi:MAG: integrase [Gammaproteobacteria bacterium RIFCSPHIGHO2_12_FULL_37_14]|nr:MAG: integrase [Gammaproteobacteria bacterium RIFCSPHIGHO2_12_FULL_37_14]
MSNSNFLSSWIKRFLLEYLISVRNLSRNTQQSYRDTFRLMLPFMAKNNKKSIENLLVDDISPDLIKSFLLDLEKNRLSSLSTRNQRLAAVHAFAKFIGSNNPEHVEWCREIQMIPFKKSRKTLITYLEKSEMDALLNAPDKKTWQGNRDHALLLFLYNTGARADEAAQLTIADLNIAHATKRDLSTVLIKGKGNKLRRCPLWKQTVDNLSILIKNREESEHVFMNRCHQPLTRFGIHAMVKRYVKKITQRIASLKKKRVSPHTIRHTTATHLLQAGVDINTIRAWLGHVSINTTNIYAEVDLEMKAKALACCDVPDKKTHRHWRDDKGLMDFLSKL